MSLMQEIRDLANGFNGPDGPGEARLSLAPRHAEGFVNLCTKMGIKGPKGSILSLGGGSLEVPAKLLVEAVKKAPIDLNIEQNADARLAALEAAE